MKHNFSKKGFRFRAHNKKLDVLNPAMVYVLRSYMPEKNEKER